MLDRNPEKSQKKTQAAKSQTLLIAIFYWIYLPRQGKQNKKTTTEWENVFTNISDKELMSKIYKELTKLNTKKTTQLKNGQSEQILIQRGHTVNRYEKMFNITNYQGDAN